MTSLARIRPSLRRAAFVAALGALLAPATAGAAVQAQASAKTKKVKLPVVTSVRPMQIQIGQTLEIRGKYFLRGRNKNSVVFKRDGGKAVFVKANVGTTKLLQVKLPAKLDKELNTQGTSTLPTRFRVRVLTKKFGKRFTTTSRSPTISAAPAAPAPAPPPPPPPTAEAAAAAAAAAAALPEGDCDNDGVFNRDETDDDNDLLSDDDEKGINDVLASKFPGSAGLDLCKIDTDGDGVEDGFEYRSARDLNDDEYADPNTYLPYPGKRPYANPLNSDAGTDYDGDSLTLYEEQQLWKLVARRPGKVRSLDSLYYSDGMKYSIYDRSGPNNRRWPALSASGYEHQIDFENWLHDRGYEFVELPDDGGRYEILDVNRDGTVTMTTQAGYIHSERFYLNTHPDPRPGGWLSDDERDEDADGLSNYDETHGRMGETWWDKKYDRENPFTSVKYLGTDADDADSDGDSIRDGADDQDHDDIPNIMELSRKQATGRPYDNPKLDKANGNASQPQGRVNPFNPCLPDLDSRTCPTYIPFGGNAWAPFDGFEYDAENDSPNYLVLN